MRHFAPRALALALVFAAPSAAHAAPAPASVTVVIKNFDFSPMAVTAPVGASVTWKNLDPEPHTVTSDVGLFHSGALDQDESFTYRFDKAGVYHYVCSIHPRMMGSITIK